MSQVCVDDFAVPVEFIATVLDHHYSPQCKCERCVESRAAKMALNRIQERQQVMANARYLIAQYFHCSVKEIDYLPIGELINTYKHLLANRNYNRFLDHIRIALRFYFDHYVLERVV